MSLLDALNQLKKDGFDAKKGKEYNPNAGIPDGDYLVSLDGVTHNANNTRDFLMVTFLVIQGDEEGKKENFFPNLATKKADGSPMPNFVTARAIADLQLLGEAIGNPVPDKCFAHDTETDAYEDLYETFKPAIGKLLKLSKTTKTSKSGYKNANYEFAKAEQPKEVAPTNSSDPFADKATGIELTDDDLPFGK